MASFTSTTYLTGLTLSVALFGSITSTPVEAKMALNDQSCNVNLNYDVKVSPRSLQISDKGEEKYRVDVDKLFVEGKAISLDSKQKQLLTAYTDEVGKQIPEAIELVGEIVQIVSTAVTMGLKPILGEDAGLQVDKLMVNIQKRVDTMAYQQGDTFFLGATDHSVEQTFNEEFEKEMEQLVTSSMGSIMMSMGSQLFATEGGSFEEKMNNFGAKMEKVGENIEQELELQTQSLEARGEKLCDDFERLVVMESELRSQIPQLSPYVLATRTN